jgi:hypothetical protein
LFDRLGWAACVAGIGASLVLAATLAVQMRKHGSAAGLPEMQGDR